MQWTHSGRITDDEGSPINGSSTVLVALYDAPAGGNVAWTDTFTVDLNDGYYSVLLGSGTPLDLDVLGADRLYVGLTVNSSVMTTRQLLASVPHSSQAYQAAELRAAGLNARQTAPISCAAILAAGDSVGTGLYWIDPNGTPTTDAFLAYCDMDTQGGGWTLALNVDPTDGGRVVYPNVAFWTASAEYGSIGSHFVSDYASPAAASVAPTELLIAVARPGPTGQVFGWKQWTLSVPNQPLKAYFNGADNTVLTTAVLGEDSASVYMYEALIGAPHNFPAHSDPLTANRTQGPSNDQHRIAASSYSPHCDANQAGLGTRKNNTHPSNLVGERIGYLATDVELWVNSTANLWCTRPSEGSFKTVGNDTWCGDVCDGCHEAQGPSYYQAWTYRVFVR
jgi:hypothetical protein